MEDGQSAGKITSTHHLDRIHWVLGESTPWEKGYHALDSQPAALSTSGPSYVSILYVNAAGSLLISCCGFVAMGLEHHIVRSLGCLVYLCFLENAGFPNVTNNKELKAAC